MPMPLAPIYTDLFDDGITAHNFLSDTLENASFEKKLLDTIRFQVLLAILFDRQIAVPECWIASSPLFLKVFSEVAKSFPTNVQLRNDPDHPELRTVYPFRLIFFTDTLPNPSGYFLTSLAERIRTNRRVLWLPEAASDPEADRLSQRAALANKVDNFVTARGDLTAQDAQHFTDEFIGMLEDIYTAPPTGDFSAVAIPLERILHRLQSSIRSGTYSGWGTNGLKTQLKGVGRSVDEVKRVIRKDKDLYARHEKEVLNFRAFFDEVEGAGKESQDVMGMWPYLQKYDPTMAQTAEVFGRLALNRGYAGSTSSAQGTLSFSYYAGGEASEFTNSLVASTVNGLTSGVDLNAAHFVETAPASHYDLVDTIEWKNIWQEAAAIARDPEWHSQRAEIELDIIRPDDPSDFGFDALLVLFDKINGHFQDLRFEFFEDGETPVARIVRTEMDNNSGFLKRVRVIAAKIDAIALSGVMKSAVELFFEKSANTEQVLGKLRSFRKLNGDANISGSRRDIIISNGR